MNVSVIATVLNEEHTIADLLDSLLSQTKKPTEIIIVDGGSKDRTTEIVKEYKKQNPIIKLYEKRGSISYCRNFAVRKTKNRVIAQIDAGCVADKEWLKKITKPFKNLEVGLVAGFYEMTGKTKFQQAIAPYHGVTKRRYDPRTFMPSGRSMAYLKSTWEKVGGYSYNVERAGEDTLFNYQVLKLGIKIVRVPDAIVYWELPRTFFESFKKLYRYAKGDGQALIWWHPAQRLSTHNIKIISIFIRYIFFVGLAFFSLLTPLAICLLYFLIVFYAFWTIYKHQEDVRSFESKLWLPFIQISSDFAVMAGFASGVFSRK